MFSKPKSSITHSQPYVDADDISRYLRMRGWQRSVGKRSGISVFRNSLGTEILLPSSEYSDYDDRIFSALASIATNEECSVNQLVDQISTPASDLIKLGLVDDSTESGSVPFKEGLRLLNGARKALAATACSVVQPQNVHLRLQRTEVDTFLDQCRLGQTERGSFIVHLVCPIEPLPFEDLQIKVGSRDRLTFGRKVTRGFVEATKKLVDAIDNETVEQLISGNETYSISANFCEALVEMQPDGERSTLVIASKWDEFTLNTPNLPLQPIRLKKRHFRAIEQVGTELRVPLEQSKPQVYGGYVDELKGEQNSAGVMEGEVILTILTEDEQQIRARVILNSDDYAKAGQAHLASKIVLVKGELHRRARLHEIRNYELLVIPQIDK